MRKKTLAKIDVFTLEEIKNQLNQSIAILTDKRFILSESSLCLSELETAELNEILDFLDEKEEANILKYIFGSNMRGAEQIHHIHIKKINPNIFFTQRNNAYDAKKRKYTFENTSISTPPLGQSLLKCITEINQAAIDQAQEDVAAYQKTKQMQQFSQPAFSIEELTQHVEKLVINRSKTNIPLSQHLQNLSHTAKNITTQSRLWQQDLQILSKNQIKKIIPCEEKVLADEMLQIQNHPGI